MLIKSSTKDSLFQQALGRPEKMKRFLSHIEILKILGNLVRIHYFLKNLAFKSIIQRIQTKKVAKARSDIKLLLQQWGVFLGLCVNATRPTKRSHQLLRLKEAFQMLDLPGTHYKKDSSLCKSPPKHPLVGTFASLPESLLPVSLIVLFLGDLFHLVQ